MSASATRPRSKRHTWILGAVVAALACAAAYGLFAPRQFGFIDRFHGQKAVLPPQFRTMGQEMARSTIQAFAESSHEKLSPAELQSLWIKPKPDLKSPF